MCSHLIAKGFAVTVYNRSRGKAQSLLEKGAAWANSPKQVAQSSDVVFAIVGFPRDVRDVFLGADGALAGCKAGNVLVDMTTSEPSLAVEIFQAAKAKGVHAIDAAEVHVGNDGGHPARKVVEGEDGEHRHVHVPLPGREFGGEGGVLGEQEAMGAVRALGLAGGAAGEGDERRIVGLDRLRFTVLLRCLQRSQGLSGRQSAQPSPGRDAEGDGATVGCHHPHVLAGREPERVARRGLERQAEAVHVGRETADVLEAGARSARQRPPFIDAKNCSFVFVVRSLSR